MTTRTVGLSPKAILAAVLPTLGGVIAVGVQLVVTGEFDRAELATALTAVGAALVSFLGAWAASPGTVVQKPEGDPMLDSRSEHGQAEPIRLLVWVLVVIIIIAFVVWLLNKLL